MLSRLRRLLQDTVAWFAIKVPASWRVLRKPQPAPLAIGPRPPPEPPKPPEPPEPTVMGFADPQPKDSPFESTEDEQAGPFVHADDPELPNRKARRMYERARRKHDKFVKAQGPEPIHTTREHYGPPIHREPVEQAPIAEDESAHINLRGKLLVDHHHEGGDWVLYEEDEFRGHFTFRDTILQQLDRYWIYLRRMQRHDPDAYGFYRQVGALLVPYSTIGVGWREQPDGRIPKWSPRDHKTELPPWFVTYRPSFGCLAYGINPLSETHELEDTVEARKRSSGTTVYTPKFMYFVKYHKPPSTLQPMHGGDVYKLTVWWDRPHDPKCKIKWGVPQEFGVFVSEDGKRIRALRTFERHSDDSKYWRTWRIPHELQAWAKQHGAGVQAYLTHLFIDAIDQYGRLGESMIQINVHKDDLTALFTLDHRRLAYFFQDRDYHLTEGGTRRPLFHFVKPHMRSDGTLVKAYFAGERAFTWAGYDVLITVPGLHHEPLIEYSPGCEAHEKPGPIPKGMLSEPQIGTFLARHIAGQSLRAALDSVKADKSKSNGRGGG